MPRIFRLIRGISQKQIVICEPISGSVSDNGETLKIEVPRCGLIIQRPVRL